MKGNPEEECKNDVFYDFSVDLCLSLVQGQAPEYTREHYGDGQSYDKTYEDSATNLFRWINTDSGNWRYTMASALSALCLFPKIRKQRHYRLLLHLLSTNVGKERPQLHLGSFSPTCIFARVYPVFLAVFCSRKAYT